eukprot:COSAG01_NODE_3081_length_6620_cov_26.409230_1_plen_210_part_00
MPVGPMADVEQSCDVYTIGNGTRQCPPLHAAPLCMQLLCAWLPLPGWCLVHPACGNAHVSPLCVRPRAPGNYNFGTKPADVEYDGSSNPDVRTPRFLRSHKTPTPPRWVSGWLAGRPNKYAATYCAGAVTACHICDVDGPQDIAKRYEAQGMARKVRAVILVHLHNHPHVLLLKRKASEAPNKFELCVMRCSHTTTDATGHHHPSPPPS